jgi:putative ABC transport system permease protein
VFDPSSFRSSKPTGKRIRIKDATFKVIGVLQEKGANLAGRDQDDVVFLPLPSAKVRIIGRDPAKPDAVQGIAVQVKKSGSINEVLSRVRTLLRERHRLRNSEKDDFRIQNLSAVTQAQGSASRQFTILVSVLAAVSLIVGGIGVMNIMLVSVTERVQEVGVRFAIGARSSDIIVQFVTESALLCIIGGVLGLVLGVLTALTLTRFLGWPISFQVGSMLLALGCAVFIGLIFGIYPARRAARLSPLEALRE